jgi:hypothetical protein
LSSPNTCILIISTVSLHPTVQRYLQLSIPKDTARNLSRSKNLWRLLCFWTLSIFLFLFKTLFCFAD